MIMFSMLKKLFRFVCIPQKFFFSFCLILFVCVVRVDSKLFHISGYIVSVFDVILHAFGCGTLRETNLFIRPLH